MAEFWETELRFVYAVIFGKHREMRDHYRHRFEANRYAVFSLMYPKLSALDKMKYPDPRSLLPLSWEMKALKQEIQKREDDAFAYMKRMKEKAIETANRMNQQQKKEHGDS